MNSDISTEGQVLGIDVGWSEKSDTTGACVLRWDQSKITLDVHLVPTSFEQRTKKLKEIVGSDKFEAVALDGPLRPGFGRIGEYRLGELILTRRFSNLGYGKPGQSSSPNGLELNAHANLIAKSVIEAECVAHAKHEAAIHELAIAEAFPTTFLAVMLDKAKRPSSKAKSDIFFEWLLGPNAPCRHNPDRDRIADLITGLLPRRTLQTQLGSITNHEHRAAVICAITALCVACRQYIAVGDSRNGYLIMPPLVEAGEAGTQPWAFNAVVSNLNEIKDWEKEGLSQLPTSPHVISQSKEKVSNSDAAIEAIECPKS
jgi:predicted RNase H-like nuclease